MLIPVNVCRSASRERQADAIRADRRLPPVPARHEVNLLPLIQGLGAPGRIENDAIRARE